MKVRANPMTVRELVAELLKHDQDLEVYIEGYSGSDGGTGEVDCVFKSHENDVTIRERTIY